MSELRKATTTLSLLQHSCGVFGVTQHSCATDGSSSPTILKQLDAENTQLFIYPNPATDFITTGLIKGGVKSALIELYDITGKLISTYNNPVCTQDQVRQVLNIESLASGVYVIGFNVDGEKHSLKFIKE